ncbi:MAG: helix-turn-helix domain-containing protein [Erysipelotrichaceae bacterium]
MHSITGYFIRYNRLARNISQESLCRGICVVSYLSKIEQGKVVPSEEIIEQLFEALQLTYVYDYSFIRKYKKMMIQAIEKTLFEESNAQEAQQISEHKQELECSPLCIDVRLFELFQNIEVDETYNLDDVKTKIEKMRVFETYMDEEQSFLYHYLYSFVEDFDQQIFHLKKAASYHLCSMQVLRLGELYHNHGYFAKAIECYQQGSVLANEEGLCINSCTASFMLGNCYSGLREKSLMLKYYRRAANIARTLSNNEILSYIYYNIGSSYLEWNLIEECEEPLLRALAYQPKEPLLFYQKLALYYIETKEQSEVTKYIALCDKELQYNKNPLFMKMNEFVHLRSKKAYLKNPRYLKVLEDICAIHEDKITFGFRVFHIHYLIAAYQANRRYKEAFMLKETLDSIIS